MMTYVVDWSKVHRLMVKSRSNRPFPKRLIRPTMPPPPSWQKRREAAATVASLPPPPACLLEILEDIHLCEKGWAVIPASTRHKWQWCHGVYMHVGECRMPHPYKLWLDDMRPTVKLVEETDC